MRESTLRLSPAFRPELAFGLSSGRGLRVDPERVFVPALKSRAWAQSKGQYLSTTYLPVGKHQGGIGRGENVSCYSKFFQS